MAEAVVQQAGALLGPSDPPPVEVVNEAGRSRILLICEHAGRAVPEALGRLGLPDAAFERHIAWDIGAEGVARRLSALLDAPLVMQRYSRLVVDCNRPFAAPDAIPEVSDTTEVPGNRGLTEADRRARFAAIHTPFHDTVAALLDALTAAATGSATGAGPGTEPQPGPVPVMVHSFTPMLWREGRPRPWHLGLLHGPDDRLAQPLMAAVRARRPALELAFNQPYSCSDLTDYSVPVHAGARGLPHVLLEIRNDLIATPEGQQDWAALLAEALREAAAPLPA